MFRKTENQLNDLLYRDLEFSEPIEPIHLYEELVAELVQQLSSAYWIKTIIAEELAHGLSE